MWNAVELGSTLGSPMSATYLAKHRRVCWMFCVCVKVRMDSIGMCVNVCMGRTGVCVYTYAQHRRVCNRYGMHIRM